MKNQPKTIARLESICGTKVYQYNKMVGEQGTLHYRIYVDLLDPKPAKFEDCFTAFESEEEALDDATTFLHYNPDLVRVDNAALEQENEEVAVA